MKVAEVDYTRGLDRHAPLFVGGGISKHPIPLVAFTKGE
jgi:hypothetical protein